MVKLILLSGEQNHRCCYCSNSMTYYDFGRTGPAPANAMTRDHVIPKSYGGCGYYQNIVIACSQCNNLRGNLHAQVFYRLMESWKKRDPDFVTTWYYVDKRQLRRLKLEVLFYQNLHLRSKRKTSQEGYRQYQRFSVHHGKSLTSSRDVQTAQPI